MPRRERTGRLWELLHLLYKKNAGEDVKVPGIYEHVFAPVILPSFESRHRGLSLFMIALIKNLP
jgi:hypothetical protein